MQSEYVDMEMGVFSDEMGRHMRFSIPGHGLAIQIDSSDVVGVDPDVQSTLLVAMVEDLGNLIISLLDNAHNAAAENGECTCGEH